MASDDELRRRLAEVEAREQEVARREKALAARSVRRNLYDRINLSARAVDLIIIACAVAIVSLVIVGWIMGRRG